MTKEALIRSITRHLSDCPITILELVYHLVIRNSGT